MIRSRSSEPTAVEQHAACVLDPGVMSGRHVERIPGPYMQLAPVVHSHRHLAFEHVSDVLDLATVGAAQRLHMLGPTPARLEHPTTNHVPVQIDQLDSALAALKLPDLVRGVEALALDLGHRSSFPQLNRFSSSRESDTEPENAPINFAARADEASRCCRGSLF